MKSRFPMRHFLWINTLLGLLGCFLLSFSLAHAQTSCLAYPSNSTPPSGYGASWDVFSSGKELLVKVTCPASGTSVTMTVGKGDPAQYVWSEAYTYQGGWVKHTLSGPQTGGWIAGSGTKSVTAPANASESNPFYFVGYTCTNVGGIWKCGCSNTACAMPSWQLQAYTGGGGGSGKKLKNVSRDDKAVCMFDSGMNSRFSTGAPLYGLRGVKEYLTPITYAPPGQMTTYPNGSKFFYDHSDAGIESGAQKLANRAIWGWEEAAEKSKLVWVDFEGFDSVNVPASVGYNRATDGEFAALYDIHQRQSLRTESMRLRRLIVSRAAAILSSRGYGDFEFVDYNAPRKLIWSDRLLTSTDPMILAEVADMAAYLSILSGTGPQTQLILGTNVLEGLASGSISWQAVIDWQVASVRERIEAHGTNGRVAPALWPVLYLSGPEPGSWPTSDHLVPPGFMADLFNALYNAGVRRFVFWTPAPDGQTLQWKNAWDARWAELSPAIQEKCQRMAWQ